MRHRDTYTVISNMLCVQQLDLPNKPLPYFDGELFSGLFQIRFSATSSYFNCSISGLRLISS
ncbi:hypothetical protein HanRHA438_Chr01g0046811 [Helianthus annuus]|nr:hypothetical protein HanRHA438_Chr01g0046811 [Helianthus annuus]